MSITNILWVEARDVGSHPETYKKYPYNKDLSDQNVNNAEVEETLA